MNNYKIERDRPRVSSEEIAQRKDFDSLLNNHQIMNRPFFKNPWFFGVTGMATIGLLIGGIYSFKADEAMVSTTQIASVTDLPPSQDNHLVAKMAPDEVSEPEPKTEIRQLTPQKKNEDDKIITLEEKKLETDEPVEVKQPSSDEQEVATPEVKTQVLPAKPDKQPAIDPRIASSPRIAGKMGGMITKSELKDERGIYTEMEVDIVGFELHVATGFGSKVYHASGHMITDEMLTAIAAMGPGEEIFFESIKAQTTSGQNVHLPAIKYTLANR